MPFIEAKISLRVNGAEVPGFPKSVVRSVDEVTHQALADTATGGNFVALDGLNIDTAQFALVEVLEGDNVSVMFNNNDADAGDGSFALEAGGFVLVVGGTMSANDRISISNASATPAKLRTVVGGT